MRATFCSYTSIGKRKNNEDSFFCGEIYGKTLAIVADGVGGYEGGEIASKLAVDILKKELDCEGFSDETLEDAIIAANQKIYSLSNDGPKTTIALAWAKDGEAYAANVGDSRIYQFRDNKIIFQSTDHSIPQLDVQAGIITKDQIRTHKDRNKITRCLGSTYSVSANIEALTLKRNDRILVCSDGFWEKIIEAEMERLCAEYRDISAWLDAMRERVKRTESDNNTAAVFSVDEI